MDDSKIFSIIFKEKLNIKKNFREKSEELVSLFSYLYIIFTNNEISMHSYEICLPSEKNILLPAKNLYMGNSFNSDIHINLIDKDIELNINFSYERIRENISKILDNFRINLDSIFSCDNYLKFKEEKFLNQENYKIFLKFTNLNSIENIFCNISKFFTLEKQINTFKWLFNLIFKEKKFNEYKDKIVESLKNSMFLSNKSCENKLPEDLFLMDEISLTKFENIFQNVKNIYFINKNFISGISDIDYPLLTEFFFLLKIKSQFLLVENQYQLIKYLNEAKNVKDSAKLLYFLYDLKLSNNKNFNLNIIKKNIELFSKKRIKSKFVRFIYGR